MTSPQAAAAEYQRLGWSVYALATTIWLTPATPIEAFNVPRPLGKRIIAHLQANLPVINIPGPPDRWALLTQPHNGPSKEFLNLCNDNDIGYAYAGHHNGRTSDWSIDLPPTQHPGHQPLTWITPPTTPLPAASTVVDMIVNLHNHEPRI
jgi:hypothetical protein